MAKVKVKTHSGAKKRFKLTKNGKVKYQHTNKRHRLTQKDTKEKENRPLLRSCKRSERSDN